uniref:CCHC-type domain-containing protein n=1 Tax=Schizophyllum commune (strain H4-8 / FGSC 9210) TaxID=578458 RepID=D8Q3A8_SCHCM
MEGEELPVSGEGAEPEGLDRDLFAVAYAVAAKRAAANTSYPFPARNDVHSKGKKPPPGPCFACGSPHHWNKDCPHWDEFEKRRREAGMLVESAADLAYDTAYVLAVEQGFDRASRTLASSERGGSKTQGKAEGGGPEATKEEVLLLEVSPFVSRVEEIADDYWHRGECLPVDSVYSLEAVYEEGEGVDGLEGRGVREEINLVLTEEEPRLDEALAALKPYDPGKIRLVPRRGALRLPDGNTSVLSVRGRVSSSLDIEIDLRIDSCASVTLVSLGHYRRLISPPPIRTDEGSRLMQLTKRDAPVRGKVRLSFQIFCDDGTTLEMECEVQIVEGMTVPVLLGEDFQQAYELSVRRALESDGTSSTTIEFGGAPEHPISATPSRAKQKLRERKKKADLMDSLILAAKETRLPPHTCVKVEVLGPFKSPGEWVVEKILLSSDDDRFLAVPNTLISSAAPFVPLANPSDSPRIIRKGEVLGRVVPAQEYFDKPKSQENLDKMRKHANLMEELCRARMTSPGTTGKAQARAPDKAWRMPHPQNYGAWAAGQEPARSRFHMPDEQAYSSWVEPLKKPPDDSKEEAEDEYCQGISTPPTSAHKRDVDSTGLVLFGCGLMVFACVDAPHQSLPMTHSWCVSLISPTSLLLLSLW